MYLKHGRITFGCTKQLNLLAVLRWVGLGPNFPLAVVWVGSDRVTENGVVDNSAAVAELLRFNGVPAVLLGD